LAARHTDRAAKLEAKNRESHQKRETLLVSCDGEGSQKGRDKVNFRDMTAMRRNGTCNFPKQHFPALVV